MCERDLVFTDSFVVENPVAWPIRPEYAAGLSYWMYQADKKHGITIDSVKEEYEKKNQVQKPSCTVELSQEEMNAEDDGFTPVKLENLAFPFMFYASFAIVASCLKVGYYIWSQTVQWSTSFVYSPL